VTCERIVESEDMLKEGPWQSLLINRANVSGVIETPGGAHFTECPPDYRRDEAFQKEYAATAGDEEAWDAFKKTYLDLDSEEAYQEAVKAR